MLPASVFGDDGFPAAALGSLASEDYKDRVQGERALIAWGQGKPEQAEERLLKEHDAATDPEVKLRLREALKEVVASEHQRKDGQGYVGIQMAEQNVALPGNGEQRGGVLVTRVNPDTPAMKAGLQANDVIIGLDNLKWPPGVGLAAPGMGVAGLEGTATAGFSTAIRGHKPGDKVDLEVLRGGEVKKLEMILTVRPMGLDQVPRSLLLPGAPLEEVAEELRSLEKKAKDEYFERWLASKRAAAKKP
ncbi:PDZ domain-containing protein [Luteolibacter soli]|uniref:PDZ domain-containing protein n=1 Tax=Luteolibacter soli TaxID=3135280 RepID=A0ABU9APS6_9BACT